MILAEPIQITQLVVNVFDKLSISYLIGGSLASSLHGIPRATQDIDIVADIKFHHIMPFVKTVEAEFYVSEDAIKEAIQHQSSFNIIHLATMFKVDIFVLKDDAISQEEMARREKYRISDEPLIELFLASAEDTILRKLYWFQSDGGVSEKQWKDVLGVLQVKKKNLDYSYLSRIAHNMNISHLLKQAFQDAGIESLVKL